MPVHSWKLFLEISNCKVSTTGEHVSLSKALSAQLWTAVQVSLRSNFSEEMAYEAVLSICNLSNLYFGLFFMFWAGPLSSNATIFNEYFRSAIFTNQGLIRYWSVQCWQTCHKDIIWPEQTLSTFFNLDNLYLDWMYAFVKLGWTWAWDHFTCLNSE